MLTPEYLENSTNKLSKLTLGFENEIFQDIAERIARTGKLSQTTDYQLTRLLEIRQFDYDYRQRLQKLLGLSNSEMDRLFKVASEKAYLYDERLFTEKGILFIPPEYNQFLQQLTLATATQTKGLFENITNTMGMIDETGRHLPLRDYFIKTLDDSVMRVATGVQSYDESIKQAISKMVSNGITIVNYSSGRNEKIEGVVRRNTLTAVKQMADTVSEYNGKELGTTIFEISYHSGNRPSHGWGGMRYDTLGIDYPTPNELFSMYGGGTTEDVNCRHNVFPTFKDMPPNYTKQELREMQKEELETTNYKWKDSRGVEHEREFTLRDSLDRQRAIERQMRTTRSKANSFKVSGLEEDYQIQRGRYRSQLAEYKRFASKMNIDPQMQRVYMDGLGRI